MVVWEGVGAFIGALARVASFVLLVGLAVLLLTHRPGHRASRIFAYTLMLAVPLALPLGAVRELAGDAGGRAWPWVQRYAALALPFAFAYFGCVFPRPRAWLLRHGWVPLGLLAAVVALEVAYALDHGLMYSGYGEPAGEPRTFGPLALVTALASPVRLAVAAVLARDFARAGPGPERGPLLLVAVALALFPAYAGTRWSLYHVSGLEPVGGPGGGSFGAYLTLAPTRLFEMLAIPFLAMLAWELARTARSGSDAEHRLLARRGLQVLALPVSAAALVTVVYLTRPELIPVLFNFFPGAFSLAFPLLVAYALLRYRIFGIDLQVRSGIRHGTVAGAFVGAALLGAGMAGLALPGDAAAVAGIALSGMVVFAALPRLQRLGDRLADAALPGVREGPEYLAERKLELYRAALEEAFLAGEPDEAARALLAKLRRELALTERDHAVLEFAVRTRGALPSARPLEPGAVVLGCYRVERPLGEGAYGTTYLARDEERGEPVALKALRPERAGADVLREARALARVAHPNVVAMRQVAEQDGRTFLAMEFVEGGSLRERLAHGPLEPEAFRRVADGVLRALEAVHAAGLVHRDVKPSNVLLTRDGEAKLADFGIAHLPGLETTVGDLASAVGTIRFMSPEQARGRRVTPRSDLFSAAATLYEAYTGKPYLEPLPGESAVELQMRAAAGRPFPRGWHGPAPLRAWFATALHPQPERRFPSARAMREALAPALARGSLARS